MDPVVVELEGEIDVQVADSVRATLLGAVREASGRPVVIDLSAVTSLDSSGLSSLIAAFKASAADGGSVSLRGPSRPVLRMLEVTGMTETFGLTDSDGVGR